MLVYPFALDFPAIAQAGKGADWVYSGWYLEMLHLTYPNSCPVAFTDSVFMKEYLATTGKRSGVRIPLPPPGWGPDEDETEELEED